MRKPNQNLDDYIVTPAPESITQPPRSVSLQRTGEVEVLRPLTLREIRATRVRPAVLHQPLWFRRFLAVGSGALVTIFLALVSAVLVGINDSAVEPDVAMYVKPDEQLIQPEEPFSFELFSPSSFLPTTGGSDVVRSNTKRRTVRSKTRLAVKPRRQSTPAPQLEQSTFVPTTLVIYAENGVINTRIEPWLQAANKTPTFDN
jgi:hypothetical protein